MDLEEQINEILKNSNNISALEANQTLANSLSIFFHSLCNNGMTREEALELTQSYLSSMIFNNKPQG